MGRRQCAEAGVEVRGDSIRIRFQYAGHRCTEPVSRTATDTDIARAGALRRRIIDEIRLGTFDYARTFPDSPRAAQFGARAPSRQSTVAQALDDWLSQQQAFVAHSTYKEYTRDVNRLKTFIGGHTIDEFDHRLVRRLLKKLAGDGLSRDRISNLMIPLRRAAALLVEDQIIARSPFDGIKLRNLQITNHSTYAPDPFSYDEMRAVLRAFARYPTIQAMYQFAFWTGMRPSEYTALRWEDVDRVSGTVRVCRAFTRGRLKETKTAAGQRDVDLLAPAQDALKVMRAHTYLAGDWVFVNPITGARWGNDFGYKRHWVPALKRAGVRHRGLYQTRHTFASTMLSEGEPLAWVSQQLGHSNVVITARIYARWIPKNRQGMGSRAVDAWGKTQ